MNVVMIPSVGGGIGHISRTATLARMLKKLDPGVNVEYVLDSERVRPFNIEATARMGFQPRLLPSRPRHMRDAITRDCLGAADVIVDDTTRYLVPLRHIVPRAAWVSIPLFPIGDELFMDWPYLAQVEAVIWAYAPVIGIPPDLDPVREKVLHTGPFLEFDDVPERAAARAKVGFEPGEEVVIYAPRGMPFGRPFGERVLSGLYGAVELMRRERNRNMRLVLLAVNNIDEIRHVPGVPWDLPEWVKVLGVVTPTEALCYTQAADVVIAEGTSTMHEAAALRRPLLTIPGPIPETWLLGTRLGEHRAAHLLWIEHVTPHSVADIFERIFGDTAEQSQMLDRAHALITGGGGVAVAARRILEIAASR